MANLQIQEALKPKKTVNQFDVEVNKGIKETISQIEFIENSLISLDQKRKQMECELQQALELPFYKEQGEIALNILAADAKNYLSNTAYQKLSENLLLALEKLTNLDVQAVDENTPFIALHQISEESLQSIETVSLHKFSEGNYSDALALFTFLTLLNPSDVSYWLRAGLAAQYNSKDLLALENFEKALEIDPTSAEAHLFSAELFLKAGQKAEYELHITQAKKYLEKEEFFRENFLELLKEIEFKANH